MRYFILFSLFATSTCTIVGGCHSTDGVLGVDRYADIPPGAVPAPQGTYACQWQQLQTSKAEQDYFVLYPNEWRYGTNEDGTRLGPAGIRRLEEFSQRLQHEPFSVVIDKSEDAGLDEARRVAVVGYFQQQGLPDAGSRVVIGRGVANGLYGVEAPRIGGGFLGTGGGSQASGGGMGRGQGGGTGGSGGGGGGFGGGGIF